MPDENNQPLPVNNDASVITNLDNLIKTHVASIDSLKVNIKKQNEMLEDFLNNNEEYKKAVEEVKQKNIIKNKTKQQLLQLPNINELATKVKEMKTEMKDQQNALSDYLREYARISGANEIDMGNGEVREIIYVARLVKKTSRK